jgi:H+-translocating NAD(P) transhydrogenase subunit alpha
MKIGILKETGSEKRVALLPEGVEILTKMNVSVLVEKGAGVNAFSGNEEYIASGAQITTRRDILENAGMIVAIHPPHESDLSIIPAGRILVGVLNPFLNHDLVRKLAAGKITSFSMELIPRISRGQSMDMLSSQATVAGYKAVLDAASRLPHFMPMFMTAAGTIKPAKVLVLGAGVAGLQALITARKLGAVVEAFDVRSAVKEEVQSLGGKFVEVEGAREDRAAGGYAVEQDQDFKKRQAQVIHDHSVKSDIVICTAQIPGKKAPVLLKKETVEQMRPGSVIVDLAAASGGNCELTENEKIIIRNGVTIIGKSDYPSDMPADASKMLGKNITSFLKLIIGQEGNAALNFDDEIVAGTCLTHEGQVVNKRIIEIMQ